MFKALAQSNKLYDSLVHMKGAITREMHDNRNVLHHSKKEYTARLAMARNAHLKERRAFEEQKLTKLLPSRFGRPPTGTRVTQNYAHRSPVGYQVAGVLADVIDAVDSIGQGIARNEKFTEPFQAPPVPAIEDRRSIEEAMQQEYKSLSARLRASEEERSRCWKKMLKTKADHDVPHQHYSGGSRRYIMPNQLSLVPVPQLRSSMTETVPQQAARSAVPTYTPTARRPSMPVDGANSTPGSSQSKYSAARVKQRISSDGTVAPVSQPKMTKEGLYQRPAGRTRKGMEWDAVRGIWVPSARSF